MNNFHTFVQESGKFYDEDLCRVGIGYAGRDEGKNNPAMQNVKGIGPLPCGLYTAQEPADDPVVGKYAMRLIPDSENEMFGRTSFFMHGDSSEHPGLASHGCIVQTREIREYFWTFATTKRIKVVAHDTDVS